MKCVKLCREKDVACPNKDCRYWIDYKDDLNCTHETIYKHGSMTLREIAKREGLSFVRIQQIEKQALKKIKKRIKLFN